MLLLPITKYNILLTSQSAYCIDAYNAGNTRHDIIKMIRPGATANILYNKSKNFYAAISSHSTGAGVFKRDANL